MLRPSVGDGRPLQASRGLRGCQCSRHQEGFSSPGAATSPCKPTSQPAIEYALPCWPADTSSLFPNQRSCSAKWAAPPNWLSATAAARCSKNCITQDLNNDSASQSKFAEISQAYNVLSDPQARTQYDMRGSQPPHGFDAGSTVDPIYETLRRYAEARQSGPRSTFWNTDTSWSAAPCPEHGTDAPDRWFAESACRFCSHGCHGGYSACNSFRNSGSLVMATNIT